MTPDGHDARRSEATPAPLASLWSLDDIHREALARLDPHVMNMIDGGAGTGATIRANDDAFYRWHLRPRALNGVAEPSLSVSVLGHPIAAPLMFSPSGLHGLAHPDGELATARAARDAGLLAVLSSNTSHPVDIVAAQGAPLWFQFYWGRDRGAVKELIELAHAAGVRALCLTADMPTRPWLQATMRSAVAAIAHVPSAHGKPRSVHLDPAQVWEHDARLTWDDLAWLRSITTLPIVVKGVMCGADAVLAAEHGAAAVIVSNHGGRTLDRGAATLEVLPEVVEHVAGKVEVYLDGGIRRGSDIAIAVALGARAVLIARPVQWGLAIGGSAGVDRVVELLLGELRSVMTMLGASSPAQLGAASLRRAA